MKNLFVFFSLLIFLSSCEKYGVVKYPEQGKTGDNILSLNQTEYSGELSMTASFNSKGSAEVEIKALNNNANEEKWSYYILENKQWNFYGSSNISQKFTSKIGARKSDIAIKFTPGKYLISISENGNLLPPRVKQIEVK